MNKPSFISSLMAVAVMIGVGAIAQDTVNLRGAVESDPVYPHIINVDLRNLTPPTPWRPGDPIKEIPRVREGKAMPYDEPSNRDPLLDRQQFDPEAGNRAFGVPGLNFIGFDYTGVNPPDTVGDVGLNYYCQSVNGGGGAVYTIYNKSDGSVAAGPFTMDQLGTGSCAGGFGDPIILYDEDAQRWMITEFSSAGNFICVYISQTSDPISGGWYNYAFNFPTFPDYPKYAVWPDAYYVTANTSGGTNSVMAMDRDEMLIGMPATSQTFTIPDMAGFNFQTTTPADLDGEMGPPADSPGIIMRHRDDEVHNVGSNDPSQDFLDIFEFSVDWDNAGNSTFIEVNNLAISEFDSSLCGLTSFFCFPQSGSGTTLDPLREVIMWRLAYRNFGTHETVVGNLVTDIDGADTGGIRRFELRKMGGPWTLFQEGTHAPADGKSRWMGGISMDSKGNIALGYNVSSSSSFPSLAYAGRLATDPAGTLPQGEFAVIDGTSPNSSNRYGDYSAMSVDPVDDCTFWFTGEYNVSTSWTTQIATFTFESCLCVQPAQPTNLSATPNGDNQIDLSWDAVAGAESYEILRTRSTCGSAQGFSTIATGVIGTTYSDTTVSGGSDYAYVVRSYDEQEDCLSVNSDCADASATGACLLPPDFDGLMTVTNLQTQACSLRLDWSDGSSNCSGNLTYAIYRSEQSDFTPSPANLIASCVTDDSYEDESIMPLTEYFYIVQAEDSNADGTGPCNSGNMTANLVRVSGVATGPDMLFLSDDVESGIGDFTTAALTGDTGTTPFTIIDTTSNSPTHSWFTPNESDTKHQALSLTTPVAIPIGGAELRFWHRPDTENNWDGGVLEYSTDGGSSWHDILDGNPNRFLEGAYDDQLNSSSNPLAGREAWNGPQSDFELTRVDLDDFAGQGLLLRWVMGCDDLVSANGWFIDDVEILTGTSCTEGTCTELNVWVGQWPQYNVLNLLSCPLNP